MNTTRQHASLILHNGQVLDMSPAGTVQQAVAVSGGRILAVGSNADILRYAEPATHIIDVEGRTIMPGLIDAHAHMEREGLKTLRPSLAHAASVADVLAVIAQQAAQQPPGSWIITMPVGKPPYYFGGPDNLQEKRMPTRAELDAVAPRHPVYIPGLFGNWGVPPGYSVLNTLGLAANGLDREHCPDCAGVVVERDATGAPTGLILEHNKRPVIEFALLRQVPAFGFADRLEGLRRSLPIYHAHGTTSVYEGHGSAPETIAVYRRLWEDGCLTMRTHLCVSPTWSDITEAKVAMRDWLGYAQGRGLGDPWLRISGIYIGLGGQHATAQAVRRALPNTGWTGFVEWANSLEDFRDYAWMAAEHNLRVHSVVVDRLGAVLDVLEQINQRFPLAPRRWVVEHIGHVTSDDTCRLLNLGVLVTSIPLYMIWKNGQSRLDEPDPHELFLPQRRLLEAGVPLSAGSDNIPVSLFSAVWASVARRERLTNRVLGPGQRLDRLQALKMITRNGAWLSFEESIKGTLEPGKLADIAVLDADPLTVPEDDLANIKAALTVVDGTIVHKQEGIGK